MWAGQGCSLGPVSHPLNTGSRRVGWRAARTHHGLLLGRARDGHAAARVHRLPGHLHVHLPVVSGDEAVVEIVVLDFQENGLPVYIVPTLQEVHGLGGDEHTVAVDVLHGDEAAGQEGT